VATGVVLGVRREECTFWGVVGGGQGSDQKALPASAALMASSPFAVLNVPATAEPIDVLRM